MQNEMHFLIIDDDLVSLEFISKLLIQAGQKVSTFSSSKEALAKIAELKPDCVICDLLLPGMDGFEVYQKIRSLKQLKQPKFIILTGKQFDFDRRKAFELGVNGYFTKPIKDNFIQKVLQIAYESMLVRFWGCRGTLPVTGKASVRYGGNTNCVTLRIAEKPLFIFDAGTGIKALSDHLVKKNKFPIRAKIFLTHPHYDHINGIPFFVPLYKAGNEFEILGADHSGISLEKLVWNQMDSVYFPITMKEFSALLTFRSLNEGEYEVEGVKVKTLLLNHPGRCLGYRIEYSDKVFCYVTDNELFLRDSPHFNPFEEERLVKFMKDADIVILDTSFSDENYIKKVGWGHSSVSRSVEVADKAKVKLLCLHHHEPDETDKDIDQKLKKAKAILKKLKSQTQVVAPHEGDILTI